MANTLGSVVLQLAVDTARFQGDLGRAAAIAESRLRSIRDTTKKSIAAISAVGLAVSGALTVAFKAAVNRAADMKDLAEATGVTAKAMSQLGYAAAQSGTDVGKVAKALQTLAAKGAADPVEKLYQLADQFSKMPDSAAKTTRAIETFGKKIGPELIPLLNKGREGLRALGDESDRVGATISDKFAQDASRFNDLLATMRGFAQGFGNTLAAELLPGLTALAQQLKTNTEQSNWFMEAARQAAIVVKLLASAVLVAATAFDSLGKNIGAYFAILKLTQSFKFGEAFDLARERAAEFRAELAAARKALQDLWNTAPTEGPPLPTAPGIVPFETESEISKRAALSNKILKDALATMKRHADEAKAAMESLETPTEKAKREFEEFLKVMEREKRIHPENAAIYDEAIARKIVVTQDFIDAMERGNEQAQRIADLQVFNRLADEAKTPLERLKEQIRQVYELAARLGNVDPATVAGIVKHMEDEYKKTYDTMTVFAEQAARNMQTAFADFLFDPWQDGMRGMLASFLDTIRRMVAEIAAQQILTQFFGWLSGLGGLWGSIGSAGVSALKTRAAGGPVMAGGTYLVGEDGPELLQLGTANGRIIPNGGFGTGSTASNVNISYHIDARGADADRIMAIMPGMMRQTEQRTIAQVRELIARGRLA